MDSKEERVRKIDRFLEQTTKRDLTFRVEDRPSAVILNLKGRLNQGALGSDSTAKVLELVEGHASPRAVFDLHEIESIDSSGVQFLLLLSKRLKEKGGQLILANPSPVLTNVLRVLNLQAIWPVFNSVDEAMEFCDKE